MCVLGGYLSWFHSSFKPGCFPVLALARRRTCISPAHAQVVLQGDAFLRAPPKGTPPTIIADVAISVAWGHAALAVEQAASSGSARTLRPDEACHSYGGWLGAHCPTSFRQQHVEGQQWTPVANASMCLAQWLLWR